VRVAQKTIDQAFGAGTGVPLTEGFDAFCLGGASFLGLRSSLLVFF
jgi:hypothetical protein